MRVQRPRMGIRRTLYGQTTLTGADRAQAPPGRGKVSRWGCGPGGGQGTQYKRSYLPSLEKPLRCDEHHRSEAPQGAGERECALAKRMVELSRENPRYGYRRVWALLRREGWQLNKKRVHRLWRKEGLKVPERQRKRRRLLMGKSENGCTRRRAEHKDHVWSYDFVMDLTEDGRRLKMMPVVDEYTRECLSI